VIIHVLGSNGMLGRYVFMYLNSKFSNVVGYTRKNIDASVTDDIPLVLSKGDVVVNCIGLIPQRGVKNPINYITINALFPHLVSSMCDTVGATFVHISTDCVFSGTTGSYTEDSVHDATDLYGRTKSLGEPENATTIRTSIIGEELVNKKSLLEWVRSMAGKDINGYTNHYWNGVTCLCLAKIIADTISNNSFWVGVKHIYSSEVVSKYLLVGLISNIYGLDIKINPVKTPTTCNKSLKSVRDDIIIEVPSLGIQIAEQKDYSLL